MVRHLVCEVANRIDLRVERFVVTDKKVEHARVVGESGRIGRVVQDLVVYGLPRQIGGRLAFPKFCQCSWQLQPVAALPPAKVHSPWTGCSRDNVRGARSNSSFRRALRSRPPRSRCPSRWRLGRAASRPRPAPAFSPRSPRRRARAPARTRPAPSMTSQPCLHCRCSDRPRRPPAGPVWPGGIGRGPGRDHVPAERGAGVGLALGAPERPGGAGDSQPADG